MVSTLGSFSALEVIDQGHTALYISSEDFIDQAKEAVEERKIERFLRRYTKPTVLILDEVGNAKFDPVSVHVFFQVVSKRYEKGSVSDSNLGSSLAS